MLSFTRAELPALTFAADPNSMINIRGTDGKDWSARLCGMGGGSSESEAADVLRQIGMQRVGGMLTVSTPRPDRVSLATVVLDAPRDAPVVVNAAYSAVAVHDMTAPVRVSAMHGRVTVLGTTGLVNAAGDAVDFASDRGQAFLSAFVEINLKMTATRFDGSVDAQAQRAVRVLLPPRFESSIEAIVTRADEFVCRADICSEFKPTRQGPLHIYRYAGKQPAAADAPRAGDPVVRLRSEEATVVIDGTDRMPRR